MQKIIDKIFKPKYPLKSAGRSMIANVPKVLPEEKILDVREKLFNQAKDFETLNYIYVTDKEDILVGVFSLKDIFRQAEDTVVEDIMVKKIIKARPEIEQEKIAFLALEHNLKAIPIVDGKNLFLGVVPSDIILKILHSENIEDVLKFAGIAKYNEGFAGKIFQASPKVLTKLRLPWLVLGLFGGLFAAQVVHFFESTLRDQFILTAFIPLIVYMADAVGTQTETLFVRSLVYQLDFRKYFLKEIKVSLIIAFVLGILLGLISYLMFSLLNIGIILGASLFFTIVSSFILGIIVPYLFNKLKKDPAIASGPIGTIIRDVLSLIIYFSIATFLLNFF